MRLRRETGDFQIRINPSNGTNAIRTGLSAEDFAGELININGTIEPVLSVSENEGVVTAKTASYTVTYNKATGAITSSEGGAGGSGGGSENAGRVFEGAIVGVDPLGGEFDYPVPSFVEHPLPAGLALEDFMHATFVFTVAENVGGTTGNTYVMPVNGICSLENHWSEKMHSFIGIHIDWTLVDSSFSSWNILYYDPATGNVYIDPGQVPSED